MPVGVPSLRVWTACRRKGIVKGIASGPQKRRRRAALFNDRIHFLLCQQGAVEILHHCAPVREVGSRPRHEVVNAVVRCACPDHRRDAGPHNIIDGRDCRSRINRPSRIACRAIVGVSGSASGIRQSRRALCRRVSRIEPFRKISGNAPPLPGLALHERINNRLPRIVRRPRHGCQRPPARIAHGIGNGEHALPIGRCPAQLICNVVRRKPGGTHALKQGRSRMARRIEPRADIVDQRRHDTAAACHHQRRKNPRRDPDASALRAFPPAFLIALGRTEPGKPAHGGTVHGRTKSRHTKPAPGIGGTHSG